MERSQHRIYRLSFGDDPFAKSFLNKTAGSATAGDGKRGKAACRCFFESRCPKNSRRDRNLSRNASQAPSPSRRDLFHRTKIVLQGGDTARCAYLDLSSSPYQ